MFWVAGGLESASAWEKSFVGMNEGAPFLVQKMKLALIRTPGLTSTELLEPVGLVWGQPGDAQELGLAERDGVHNEVVLLQSVHHRPQDAFLRPSRLLRWNNKTYTVSPMRLFSFRVSTTVRRMPFLDPVGSYDGTTKQIQCPLWGGSPSVGSYDGTTKQIQCALNLFLNICGE